MTDRSLFLPTTPEDIARRGWDAPDFVFVSGDAYVDHPSFAMAILGRTLEHAGYRVAMLAQPDYRTAKDFKRFGRPKLGFLVSAGNLDSLVSHYTAAKKPRSEDDYSPGGKADADGRRRRPDRATIVYCNRIRQAYGGMPIVVGGVEASMRRFSHYDYWDDAVRRSVLLDAGADLLVFGMGERILLEIASKLRDGVRVSQIRDVRGTCYAVPATEAEGIEGVRLPSHEAVLADARAHARAFAAQEREQDAVRGRTLLQACGGRVVVQNPPALPLARTELDEVYGLNFTRKAHPDYDAEGGVPALEEVSFSITACRGCYGSCAFCSIGFHQGRVVQSRSKQSIVREAKLIAAQEGFKGYIHDVGGPTANFRNPACADQLKRGACAHRSCLFPKPCPQLRIDHREMMEELREIRQLPGVKKVFVRSGIRYDALMCDKTPGLLTEICQHHVSGQLKVAPEHVSERVLNLMGKPGAEVFERFGASFAQASRAAGKEQYLVPYFISGHPGADIHDAIELAVYMKRHRIRPEQVQDFYPTPGTRATVMYATGLEPTTLTPVIVARATEEKAQQRALLQWFRPENAARVRRALENAKRTDLIGFGPDCLIKPFRRTPDKPASKASGAASGKPATGRGGKRPAKGKTPQKPTTRGKR